MEQPWERCGEREACRVVPGIRTRSQLVDSTLHPLYVLTLRGYFRYLAQVSAHYRFVHKILRFILRLEIVAMAIARISRTVPFLLLVGMATPPPCLAFFLQSLRCKHGGQRSMVCLAITHQQMFLPRPSLDRCLYVWRLWKLRTIHHNTIPELATHKAH